MGVPLEEGKPDSDGDDDTSKSSKQGGVIDPSQIEVEIEKKPKDKKVDESEDQVGSDRPSISEDGSRQSEQNEMQYRDSVIDTTMNRMFRNFMADDTGISKG